MVLRLNWAGDYPLQASHSLFLSKLASMCPGVYVSWEGTWQWRCYYLDPHWSVIQWWDFLLSQVGTTAVLFSQSRLLRLLPLTFMVLIIWLSPIQLTQLWPEPADVPLKTTVSVITLGIHRITCATPSHVSSAVTTAHTHLSASHRHLLTSTHRQESGLWPSRVFFVFFFPSTWNRSGGQPFSSSFAHHLLAGHTSELHYPSVMGRKDLFYL